MQAWQIAKGILLAFFILWLGASVISVISARNTDAGGEFTRMADEAEEGLKRYDRSLCEAGNQEACQRSKGK